MPEVHLLLIFYSNCYQDINDKIQKHQCKLSLAEKMSLWESSAPSFSLGDEFDPSGNAVANEAENVPADAGNTLAKDRREHSNEQEVSFCY